MNFTVNNNSDETDFSEVEDPITFLNNVKSDEITIEEAKESQEDFNKYLKKIRRGKKPKMQEVIFSNINRLFNGRNDAIKFIEGYSSIIIEAKKKLQKNQQQVKDLKG